MSSAPRDPNLDLIAIPRVVLSRAVEMVQTMERAVVGDGRVRTARGNAWEAICADRARAHQRDEVRRLVAALAAGRAADRADGNAETSDAAPETALLKTSDAVVETSDAVLQTSDAVLQTSDAVLQTSDAVLQTSDAG